MSESAIIAELQAAVTAAVAASDDSSLPIAYISKDFDKPDDRKFLQILWFPANPTDRYWGEAKTYRGTIRLVLHWPMTGSDVYEPLALMQSILGYFTKTLVLNNVRISDIPDFTGPLPDGDEILYPYDIRYRSFRS